MLLSIFTGNVINWAKAAILAVIGVAIIWAIGWMATTFMTGLEDGRRVNTLETQVKLLSTKLEQQQAEAAEQRIKDFEQFKTHIAELEKANEVISDNAKRAASAANDDASKRLRDAFGKLSEVRTTEAQLREALSTAGSVYQECRNEYRSLGYEASSLATALGAVENTNLLASSGPPLLGVNNSREPMLRVDAVVEVPSLPTTTASPYGGGESVDLPIAVRASRYMEGCSRYVMPHRQECMKRQAEISMDRQCTEVALELQNKLQHKADSLAALAQCKQYWANQQATRKELDALARLPLPAPSTPSQRYSVPKERYPQQQNEQPGVQGYSWKKAPVPSEVPYGGKKLISEVGI